MDFKFEHLLLFVVAIFLLYHLLGGCGCANRVDGFSVGGQSCIINCCGSDCESPMSLIYITHKDMCNRWIYIN